uniref:hypothetical protein Ycf63 n=1 Tax=Hypnea cervicornis TaxID=387623 RepID=UPI0021B6B2EE|nr:hypothetical protein Ycf63 [Hypnea cervicornis]UVW80796.1 hypothetical protein Ycf63 [Hypnea cervicornis]
MVFHLNIYLYKYFVNISRAIYYHIINYKVSDLEPKILLEIMYIVGPGSLSISLITAFFVSIVFTLQIAKEFLYLNATALIGAVVNIAFLRELSPVLTSVIIIGRIGSCFTAELATMQVTQQIDALYVLNTDPLFYLIIPRIISCILLLPTLNFLSFITSLASSAFICFTLYSITPSVFFNSVFSSLLLLDLLKSSLKSMLFGLVISIISCSWGLLAKGGAKGVGKSTTSSVVLSLLLIFIFNFLLSYYMFGDLGSSLKVI